MKKIIVAFTLISLLFSCGSTRNIPVQTIEKIIYKDSIIYVHDTMKINVPYEIVKETIPDIDTSYLKTSIAESTAYLDTTQRKLVHTLTQKGELEIMYDTIIKFQYVDKISEKEVPVEVEVVKYKRDALFWVLAGWVLLTLIYVFLKNKIF